MISSTKTSSTTQNTAAMLLSIGVMSATGTNSAEATGSWIHFPGQSPPSSANVPSHVNLPGQGASEVVSTRGPWVGSNQCENKDPRLNNTACFVEDDEANPDIPEQAAANITVEYEGLRETEHTPLETPFFESGLCPVNVHWHLGAEHYSEGEFDSNGVGPSSIDGRQCRLYDETDPKFTTPFIFQHCDNSMEVGQTYEVHWPHSAGGACGTPDQYQPNFYDGLFCNTFPNPDLPTPHQVGVQGQVFTIVNDEDYFYPDLIRGMIVDGDYGREITKYTGSSTGGRRNNDDACSRYGAVTWQVDRKCHLISASSFDKLCADLESQRNDFSDKLAPEGSRPLVDDKLAANNQVNRKKNLRARA